MKPDDFILRIGDYQISRSYNPFPSNPHTIQVSKDGLGMAIEEKHVQLSDGAIFVIERKFPAAELKSYDHR